VSDRRCSSALPLTFPTRSAKPLSTASPGTHPYRVQTRGTADRRIITAASNLSDRAYAAKPRTTLPHRNNHHVRSRLSVSHILGSYDVLSGHSSSEAVCAGFNAFGTNFTFSNIGSVVRLWPFSVSANRYAIMMADFTTACTQTQQTAARSSMHS
jgi:hypothetical protein